MREKERMKERGWEGKKRGEQGEAMGGEKREDCLFELRRKSFAGSPVTPQAPVVVVVDTNRSSSVVVVELEGIDIELLFCRLICNIYGLVI